MKKIIKKIIKKFNSITKNKYLSRFYPDIIEREFWEIYSLCSPYTMTSVPRLYTLYSSVDYVLKNNIEGDFVECGVWRGGSSMLIAQMLYNRNITDRKLYLYDTFEGMSEPSKYDLAHNGVDANVVYKEEFFFCLADLNDVKNNMLKTNFSNDNLVFTKGKIEDTIPARKPSGKIALLRLDTDWYESTKHELIHLFPLVAEKGVLIIDDYGYWQGCRKAVDEYIKDNKLPILLNRIDSTGRIVIKSFS